MMIRGWLDLCIFLYVLRKSLTCHVPKALQDILKQSAVRKVISQADISITGKKWVVAESIQCREEWGRISWDNVSLLIITYMELFKVQRLIHSLVVTTIFEVGHCCFHSQGRGKVPRQWRFACGCLRRCSSWSPKPSSCLSTVTVWDNVVVGVEK